MLSTLLNLFKFNGYSEIAKVYSIVHALMETFVHDKFVDGENSRDAAIDAVIKELLTQKSDYIAK